MLIKYDILALQVMKFSDTKKFIGVAVLAGLFIGSLLTFCHAMTMPMSETVTMDMATHTSITLPVECFNSPSYCPDMVANSLKELLKMTPFVSKVLLLFLVLAFIFFISKLTKFVTERFLEPCSYSAYIPPPSYLELAFARGILHSKLYNAAI